MTESLDQQELFDGVEIGEHSGRSGAATGDGRSCCDRSGRDVSLSRDGRIRDWGATDSGFSRVSACLVRRREALVVIVGFRPVQVGLVIGITPVVEAINQFGPEVFGYPADLEDTLPVVIPQRINVPEPGFGQDIQRKGTFSEGFREAHNGVALAETLGRRIPVLALHFIRIALAFDFRAVREQGLGVFDSGLGQVLGFEFLAHVGNDFGFHMHFIGEAADQHREQGNNPEHNDERRSPFHRNPCLAMGISTSRRISMGGSPSSRGFRRRVT